MNRDTDTIDGNTEVTIYDNINNIWSNRSTLFDLWIINSLLTWAQEAPGGGFGGWWWRQALISCCYWGQEGGEVKSWALTYRWQDGWRSVWWQRVVQQAYRGAQVALEGRDAGVHGGSDERAWSGWRDDQGLRSRATLYLVRGSSALHLILLENNNK